MISKRKRNTILAYCIASVVMLCALASNLTKVTTNLKTNSKKVVADNNYVEVTELSYGLVALEASSAIEENKDAKNVTEKTEEKKEEANKESNKTSNDKNESSSSKKSNSNTTKKTTSNTTVKKSNKTTSKKTTTVKKTSNALAKTTSNKNVTSKTSNKTTSNKVTSNKTASTSNSTAKSSTTKSSKGVQIANYAKQFVGNPYVMGGTSLTKGADCSGFTQSVYKHFGINLPRVARDQAKVGKKVSWNELQPGDLVFYSGNGGKSVTHVAIYIGNSKIVHAQTPSLGIGITTSNIMVKMTARRVI